MEQNSNDMKKTFSILALIVITASIVSGKVVRHKLGIFQSSVPETETLAQQMLRWRES